MNVVTSKADCVQEICRFPKVYSEESISPVEVVKRSEYWTYRDDISIKDIKSLMGTVVMYYGV